MTDYDLAIISQQAYKESTWEIEDISALHVNNVLAFRGTVPTNIKDWLVDLDALPEHDDELGWCHEGFLTAYRKISKLVDYSIPFDYVTGHSLGGALAIIACAILNANGHAPKKLVTFGAPRTGGSKLKSLLKNIEIIQYRNGNDPVPEVPWLPGIFEHIVDLTPIGESKLDPIEAHFLAGYISALHI